MLHVPSIQRKMGSSWRYTITLMKNIDKEKLSNPTSKTWLHSMVITYFAFHLNPVENSGKGRNDERLMLEIAESGPQFSRKYLKEETSSLWRRCWPPLTRRKVKGQVGSPHHRTYKYAGNKSHTRYSMYTNIQTVCMHIYTVHTWNAYIYSYKHIYRNETYIKHRDRETKR